MLKNPFNPRVVAVGWGHHRRSISNTVIDNGPSTGIGLKAGGLRKSWALRIPRDSDFQSNGTFGVASFAPCHAFFEGIRGRRPRRSYGLRLKDPPEFAEGISFGFLAPRVSKKVVVGGGQAGRVAGESAIIVREFVVAVLSSLNKAFRKKTPVIENFTGFFSGCTDRLEVIGSGLTQHSEVSAGHYFRGLIGRRAWICPRRGPVRQQRREARVNQVNFLTRFTTLRGGSS